MSKLVSGDDCGGAGASFARGGEPPRVQQHPAGGESPPPDRPPSPAPPRTAARGGADRGSALPLPCSSHGAAAPRQSYAPAHDPPGQGEAMSGFWWQVKPLPCRFINCACFICRFFFLFPTYDMVGIYFVSA